MKYIDIVRFYKIFLFFLLCACVSPMKAGTITVSSFEYAEIMKNPDAMYVCCDENMSDIKQVVFEISKLDKDKTSPLHLFKRFLRSGFNFVLYDEAVHVLEYAELVVQKKAIEMGNKKIKHVAKKLAVVIQQVLNKELHYDVKQLLSQQRIIEIFPITEDDINTEQRSITIHETIDAKDNVIFKKNIRIHGTLKAYADALFKDKAQFEKTVKFKKNITVKDTVVADSLSVNDAVIQFLEVPGGIVITDVSLDNASITDAF